jgi:starch phosphorylase
VLPEVDPHLPAWEQDQQDSQNLYRSLEEEVLPAYYNSPERWQEIVFKAIDDVVPQFTTRRMAQQYYEELY